MIPDWRERGFTTGYLPAHRSYANRRYETTSHLVGTLMDFFFFLYFFRSSLI